MPSRSNLILITCDAWRADFVDEHAGVRLLPALDRVADRTVRFDRCYANAPWTTPALVSVFSGEPVLEHGVHYQWSSPRPGGPSIAGTLRQAGWSVPNLSYLNRIPNYENLGYSTGDAPDSDDPALLLRAIEETPEPFFLWFHYKHTHLPYWAQARYRAAMGIDDSAIEQRLLDSVCQGFVVPRHQFTLQPEDRDMVRRLYAAQILQMNDWLSQVFGALEARGLIGETSLVLTADHGEELLDHGHVGHASTAHHAVLYEEVLHIPLFIIDPRASARRVRARVQGLDLYPTLLELAAGAYPPDCTGISLAPLVRGESPVLPDDREFTFHSARMGSPTTREYMTHDITAVSDGRIKRVVERYDETRAYRFDLAADPAELSPITDPP